MPAIRDSSWAFESTTTDAGITIPMCAYAQNDLLIVLAMADTGAPTWTAPTGFTTLFTRNNTTPNICFIKIATASEADPVVAAVGNETYNGCVISIRDVDTASPLPSTNVASYSESNQDSTVALGNGTNTGIGQSFTATAGLLSKARFYLSKTGSPTGNITAKLYAHSGTLGVNSVPTGAALATSNTVAASSLTGSLTLTDFYFPSTWFTLVNATNYVVTVEYNGGDGSNFVNVGYDGSAPTHGGNYSVNTGTWAADVLRDVCFYVQRFNYTEAATAGGARLNQSTTTTDRDNSLIIHWVSSSAVQMPAYCEGPVNHLTGGDGAAESMGVGWSYLKTAGTSSSAIFSNSYATGSGVLASIAVQPPLTGATIIPPYLVTDNCALLDLMHGTTAYNGNTAFAATADTNFGTGPFSSITANDATVAAITDVGLLSFHSMAGTTNATTTGQISGAETVFSVGNRPNVGTKNILCHIRPATPLQSQRFTNVSSGRGAWFGMRSNTTGTSDHKIWQVHAIDAPWAPTVHVPVVINSGAGNTKDNAGTLSTSAITAFGFWHGGITGTNTCQMGWGMLWSMDSIVLCGGNSTEPITIPGIVKVTAVPGKERYSAILQGVNQMLLIEDLQIGNGGTNPTYLNLDSTAIEFPSQYNSTTKNINYNSTDNVIGLTYYAGSSDTIIHKDSIISSPSRYKWGLHASSSTSATYNFSGLAVIGAGTITLNRAITITGLTINNYSTLNVSDANLDQCVITSPPSTNDSITTNTSTVIERSTISVTTVSSGNRWCSTTTPVIFENNAFTGSGSAGHAIRITSAGTYSFVGNTFTSFGADGTNSAAIFNDSGGSVTLNITGGGGTPTVRNGAGASTTINNAVNITVRKVKSGDETTSYARVRVEAASGGPLPVGTQILNAEANTTDDINAGFYKATTTFNFTSNQPVTIYARSASKVGRRYLPFSTTGTITSSGLDVTAVWILDTIAD